MRNRTLILSGLIVVLALLLLSCTMGSGGVSNVTATPTKTPRPLFTSTHTPTAMPLPTDTAVVPTEPPPTAVSTEVPPTEAPPTATPLPPTEAPPTEVPPTDTTVPPTDTTVPPTEAPPTNTPQPKPTNPPAPPTNTPKPQVDFRVKEIVAFEDGSLTASGLHNIYFTVVDAGGAPIDGIILKDANNQAGEEVTTGDKGPGRTEFTMWAADYHFKVIGNVSGKAFTSDTTHVLSVLHGHAVWDDLIRGGICSDPVACEAMGSIHYSYNVTFQRTW